MGEYSFDTDVWITVYVTADTKDEAAEIARKWAMNCEFPNGDMPFDGGFISGAFTPASECDVLTIHSNDFEDE
jgi:hypothetical protein